MKKIIVLAILASLSLQTRAQIVSSRSSMVTRESVSQNYYGWSTFGVEYLPTTIKYKKYSESFTGLALNYTNAISITQSAPLFIEWGIGAQYSFGDDDENNNIDISYKIVSIKAPINFIYDIELPNSTVNLDPFVGIKFRFNVWGEAKYDYDNKYDDYYYDSKTIDLFKSDEGDCNRFQVGMQLGLKARFNDKFFVGLGYGFDFNKFNENTDAKIQEFKIMAGLVF